MIFGNRKPKPINLALQGGGAHGAFTWGVLDRLLESEHLTIEGLSGTSAGAINAVVLVSGFQRGGRTGAREALRTFWRAVSREGRMSPVQRSLMDHFLGNWSPDQNPMFLALDVASRFISPYEFNPFNINPLKEILEREVDFDAVRSSGGEIRLFISATNVRTGKARVFQRDEINADVVMASACLPFLFQAVEIDGAHYWDGGYVGNPPLYPLFGAKGPGDIIVVQTNPATRDETPQTARDIVNRVNEITFNASLQSEYRAIGFASQLVRAGFVRRWSRGYRPLRLHRIAADGELRKFTASSKFNIDWAFFQRLHEIGRAAADEFLGTHLRAIGRRATLDLRQELI